MYVEDLDQAPPSPHIPALYEQVEGAVKDPPEPENQVEGEVNDVKDDDKNDDKDDDDDDSVDDNCGCGWKVECNECGRMFCRKYDGELICDHFDQAVGLCNKCKKMGAVYSCKCFL